MTNSQMQQIYQSIHDLNDVHEDFKKAFWQTSIDHFQDQLTDQVATKLRKMQMTHSEMQILSFVTEAPERTLAYQDLVGKVPFSQGMLSRYVKKLASAELLTRFHQADNKKAVYVSVTDLGQLIAKLHADMHQTERDLYAKALAPFDDTQMQNAVDVMHALATIKL
ncbi:MULTISPECIES: MarR family winged helix-turn-helix transcriptional regulator [Furfurilactobacillus]|uniref:Winged helix DNA-binding protein n=1 Tax=Furfurilactobacillus milii TaxID=2888272 RepID=A0A6N9I362_9LACO|nr:MULTISPECIES: winged helix DNA-binding protein [Furfurilactobacillus]MCF6165971.1 winged helix DNA-binding protein [Furfurilactobacillus rossiae]MYV17405.1 winged helix DNA-binding protein [Furfurilactobacillus milii]QLE62949.1 Transcriptional regulator [Furfurilactobacillus rossiae]